MRRTLCVVGLCIASLVLAPGCKKPDVPIIQKPDERPSYEGQLPEGEKALVKIRPDMYPDFSEGFEHKTNLIRAAEYSKEYLQKKSSQQFFPYLDITHERAIASIDAFIEVLNTARSGQELDQMIKQRFDVYQSRGYQAYDRSDADPRWKPPDTGIVWFTGYYCPIFDARLKPDAEFRWPLYKKPDELVLDPVTMHYHPKNGGIYLTRAQIESGALAGRGLELCYLRDWFQTYIVTIQGSAKLRMPDGSFMEIGYAADNGHEYQSVGRELVTQNQIPADQLSLQGLISYFQQHPEARQAAINVNPRYVFFMPRKGGPFGSLGVPVMPFRSVATDKQIFPRAGICFLQTKLPYRDSSGQVRAGEQAMKYGGFALDQDTGGAIRAAGRCDLFMGTGDEWGELAGRTMSEGALYYIYVRNGTAAPTAGVSGSPPPPPSINPQPTAPPPARQTRQQLTSELPPS